jgi:hypothetical protein
LEDSEEKRRAEDPANPETPAPKKTPRKSKKRVIWLGVVLPIGIILHLALHAIPIVWVLAKEADEGDWDLHKFDSFQYVHVNGKTENIAITSFLWDGKKSTMDIQVPSHLATADSPVTQLGHARTENADYGYDLPFHISFEQMKSTHNLNYPSVVSWSGEDLSKRETWIRKLEFPTPEFIDLRFNVSLPASLTEIYKPMVRYACIQEPDDASWAKVYLPKFYFTVDPANATFYSKEGKIYRKADDSLVEAAYDSGSDEPLNHPSTSTSSSSQGGSSHE